MNIIITKINRPLYLVIKLIESLIKEVDIFLYTLVIEY